jgi:Mg2+-importing ATPase
MMTALVMAIGIYLPFSPFASYLKFTPLPTLYWPFLILTLLGYMLLTQFVKQWLLRKRWI